MQWQALIFSLIFFLAALIYLYWGITIIRINPKERVNQIFLVLSIALFVWSMSYAINNFAQDIEMALFWRRVGSLGRLYFFAIVLHFMLLLTQKKDALIEKWMILLIYLPTLLLVYVFCISNTMAPMQYDLMLIDYGWVDKPITNSWTKLYYFYLALYMLLSLAIAEKWKRKLKNEKVSQQANLIIISIVIAFVFGGLLDIIPSIVLETPFPHLTSIVILIPVYAIYYAARNYELFRAETVNGGEIIVTSQEQEKIFVNVARAFYLASLLTFLSEYIPFIGHEGAFQAALLKGLTLFVIGVMIRLIQTIKQEEVKENLTIIVIVLSIPIVLFQFINQSSVTVWAFPLILVIISIIFSKRTLLFAIIIAAIISQMVIWLFYPQVSLTIDGYDYILRIGLFMVALIIGLYTNNIYVSKIKDNKEQMIFQEMTSDILFDFLDINQENGDEKFKNLLESMGIFFKADRTYIFTVNHQKARMTYSNGWSNGGISSEIENIQDLSLDVFPWWLEGLEKNQLIYIEDVSLLPDQARAEKELLRGQNVKSLISVPILVGGQMKAFMSIDSVRSHKEWTAKNIKRLKIMANIVANGFIQIEAEKEIEFMAYYDNLTRIPNRLLFKDRLERAISLAKRKESFVSVIFIDLDNFKTVNDTMGHAGGDYLLKEVADRLSSRIRKTDTLARFGGDEFVIMLNDINHCQDISKIADNIMTIFSEPIVITGQEFFITASGGIATFPIDGEDSESLIRNADMAMYVAKDQGKNGYSLCTPCMKDKVKKNMKLSNDLYRALEKNELCIYYQPQVNLANQEITGLEALLRWQHPQYGMIPPLDFIPLAEKSKLINRIGEWVLKTACAQNKQWQDMGLAKLQMAVNLSGVQVANVQIADDVERVLDETKLDPKYLELEITESIAIKETDFVIKVLTKLKQVGIAIAIDDFGTEYSSLNRLKKLPIDRLKIDMTFIKGIETNKKDQAITMVIINLAKSLGLNVLAEGVETGPQLDFLKQKGCDYVQGYYYYKPMPAQAIGELLIKIKASSDNNAKA